VKNPVFPHLPARAMVLSAGFGKRMLPLTLSRPKPMIPVLGRSLIDRTLDRLHQAGVQQVVVNTHYKADMLHRHLEGRTEPEIIISHEDELLDTGGGILNALPHFDGQPFISINSDVVWRDDVGSLMDAMGRRFDPDRLDLLLAMQPTMRAGGYRGIGDFDMDGNGRLSRRRRGRMAPFVFTGIQIVQPHIFDGMKVEPFSMNRLFDQAIESGRLFGLRHSGDWIDVGHPDGLRAAETYLRSR